MAFDYAAKIQKLLANAENEALPEAARQAYRNKAEELMDAYRIAEEDALATDPGSARPTFRTIRLTTRVDFNDRYGHQTMDEHRRMVWALIARHCGIRYATLWDDGDTADACGYDGDLRYAEFLWTAASLMFSTRLDPVWDASLTEAENIYRLRGAGIERRIIADMAWGTHAGKLAANRSKVQRIYLAECKRRGEEPMATGLGFQTDVYRQAYAEQFRATLRERLDMARDAADTVRGGLVLHGRSDRVDEAFYERYPARRPKPAGDVPTYTPCPRCAQNVSGTCREHPYKGWTRADERAYLRRQTSASARAGKRSGADAADGVLINRGGVRPDRMDAVDRQELES